MLHRKTGLSISRYGEEAYSCGPQNNSSGRGEIEKNTPCTGNYPAVICIPGTTDRLVVFQDPGSRRYIGPGIRAATLVVTHMQSVSRLELLEMPIIGI